VSGEHFGSEIDRALRGLWRLFVVLLVALLIAGGCVLAGWVFGRGG